MPADSGRNNPAAGDEAVSSTPQPGWLIHIDKFEAWLDGELLCVSRQPRLDGARELLRRGYSPDTLMTTRADGRDYDSWTPAPIGELARWTIIEEDKKGLRRRPWKPHPNAVSRGPVDSRTRRSRLRGAKVPGSDDDAVAANSGEAAA